MSNNLQGILWALVATALFATALAMVKIAVVDFHVLQILFIRQVVVLASALPALCSTFPQSLKTERPVIHAVRLTGAFVALSTGIWAVALLPLTTAITLAFSQVFFVALLASRFLDERVDLPRIIAVIVGFIGVIVVIQPGPDGFLNVAAFIPVAGALGAATAVICVRTLSQTESTATLLGYQAVVIGLLSGIPLLWVWTTPTVPEFAFLFGIGILSAIAQWFGVKALRLGEASVVGNMEYSKLIYAVLIGYLVFAEIPDLPTIAGALIIISAALTLLHRETLNRHSAA
ncbi:MAG: DMT family transporter [Stappiaceae bacterium]